MYNVGLLMTAPTAAVRGSKLDLGMWDLWWHKRRWAGFLRVLRFPLQSSFAPPITPQSPLCIIRGMYNRSMCGRSSGTYTNLGDLQKDLMGVKSHPTKLKRNTDDTTRFVTPFYFRL
jgi:hypothetical protein